MVVDIPKIAIVSDTSNIPQDDLGNRVALYVTSKSQGNRRSVVVSCLVQSLYELRFSFM